MLCSSTDLKNKVTVYKSTSKPIPTWRDKRAAETAKPARAIVSPASPVYLVWVLTAFTPTHHRRSTPNARNATMIKWNSTQCKCARLMRDKQCFTNVQNARKWPITCASGSMCDGNLLWGHCADTNIQSTRKPFYSRESHRTEELGITITSRERQVLEGLHPPVEEIHAIKHQKYRYQSRKE